MNYLFEFLIQVSATIVSTFIIKNATKLFIIFNKFSKRLKKIIILLILLISLETISIIFKIPLFTNENNSLMFILTDFTIFYCIYVLVKIFTNIIYIIKKYVTD